MACEDQELVQEHAEEVSSARSLRRTGRSKGLAGLTCATAVALTANFKVAPTKRSARLFRPRGKAKGDEELGRKWCIRPRIPASSRLGHWNLGSSRGLSCARTTSPYAHFDDEIDEGVPGAVKRSAHPIAVL